MPRSQRLAALGTLVAFVALGFGAAHADDAAPSFTPNTNTAGARWTYGWTPSRGGAFTLFATHGTSGGLDYWNYATNQTRVEHNGTLSGITIGGNTYTPSGGLNLFPGSSTQFAVVRWTAPASGTYSINAHFIPRVFTSVNTVTEVAVLHGGAVVFDRLLNFYGGLNTASVAAALPVLAGETIDFVVGPGDFGNFSDVVGLDATVDVDSPPLNAAGPVFTLGGQRFAASRWGVAFESIAFDPVHQHVASENKIRDLCGNELSAGPDEQPGLAWDSKTGTYWQVTNDRVVRRWTAAGALLDTVFTVPLTFTVPGSGADTLESVRGIATDSSFVYLVDAGAAPGAPASCEWFKFSRTGSPVKSSKSTNFSANLDLDPDALVDDVVYMPYGAPLYPGMLLVALEHSGIQVIDVNGNFVDKFRWSQQALPGGRPLSAFSGLAVDPATGNLYLADNGFGCAMVLTRLTNPGATYYALGTVDAINGTAAAQLKLPQAGCNLPLWNPYGIPASNSGNFFGLAYRPASSTVFAMDYSSGELWRFDPRLGAMQRVGNTGISSAWGLAYDSERDVLYTAVGANPAQVFVIDPLSGSASTLPQFIGFNVGSSVDIAWDSSDKKIYVVDRGSSPAHLIRIDRDTGVGSLVGNTHAVSGLDYDPASNRLIGTDNAVSEMFRIDPATGVADSLAPLPRNIGWEGLAVIPVPANPLTVSVPATDAPHASLGLGVYPNPQRDASTVRFAIRSGGMVDVGVFDVSGRRVRGLAHAWLPPGDHQLHWDGRDVDGVPAPSGIYFVRLDAPDGTRVTRVSRLR